MTSLDYMVRWSLRKLMLVCWNELCGENILQLRFLDLEETGARNLSPLGCIKSRDSLCPDLWRQSEEGRQSAAFRRLGLWSWNPLSFSHLSITPSRFLPENLSFFGTQAIHVPYSIFPIHSGEPHHLYTYVYIVADPHYWLSLMKQRLYKRDRENNSWILSSDSTVHDLPGGSA